MNMHRPALPLYISPIMCVFLRNKIGAEVMAGLGELRGGQQVLLAHVERRWSGGWRASNQAPDEPTT